MAFKFFNQIWDMELPCSEKIVLLALADKAREKHGDSCFVLIETLAKMTSKSEATVYRALDSLKKAGHISIHQKRRGRSNVWKIHPNLEDKVVCFQTAKRQRMEDSQNENFDPQNENFHLSK